MRNPIPAHAGFLAAENRRLYCRHYERCLDTAVARRWLSFVCTECDCRDLLTRPEGNDAVEAAMEMAELIHYILAAEDAPASAPGVRRCKVLGCDNPVAKPEARSPGYRYYCLSHARALGRDNAARQRAKRKEAGRG